MKTLLLTAALFTTALTLPMAAQTPNVTYLDHEKVSAAIAKGSSLMKAPNVTVSGSHRTGPGHRHLVPVRWPGAGAPREGIRPR